MDVELIKKLDGWLSEGRAVALVTVIEKTGSGPRGKGSMMIVDDSGTLLCGSIGGGTIEGQAKIDAAECIKAYESKVLHYELTMSDMDEALGMACGGTMDVFIKTFEMGDPLVVVGGGHVGSAVSKMAKQLGYHVTVIDDREYYGSRENSPWADRTFSGDIVSFLKGMTVNEKTSIVIVTHGHNLDLEALEACIEKDVRYIGMIGSEKKNTFVFGELMKKGITKEQLARVYGPIGLDIGGERPEEIAVAILSEIQAVKYKKAAPFLRDVHKLVDSV